MDASKLNPYSDWLGIAAGKAADHYELLGVRKFEPRAAVIQAQYEQRYAIARRYQVGQYEDAAQRLLDELSTAFHCLSDAAARQAYDDELHAKQAATSGGEADAAPQVFRKPPRILPPLIRPAPETHTTESAEASVAVAVAETDPPDVIDGDEAPRHGLAYWVRRSRSRPRVIGVLVLLICCITAVAIYAKLNGVGGAVDEATATVNGSLVRVVIDNDGPDQPVAHLLVKGSVQNPGEVKRLKKPELVEVYVRDRRVAARLSELITAEENNGAGAEVSLRALPRTVDEASLGDSRLRTDIPLFELTTLSADQGRLNISVGELEANVASIQPNAAQTNLIQQLRTVGRSIRLDRSQVEVLEAKGMTWRARIANRDYIVAFSEPPTTRQYDDFQSGGIQVELQPTGKSIQSLLRGTRREFAELLGSVATFSPGAQVEWSGMLLDVRKGSLDGSAPAAVQLRVTRSDHPRSAPFVAVTTDLSFGREVSDFVPACEAAGAGDQVTVRGQIAASPADGFPGGDQLLRVEIEEIERNRDHVVARVGASRTLPLRSAAGGALNEKLRTIGEEAVFAASVVEVLSRSPGRLRISTKDSQCQYVLNIEPCPVWARPLPLVRVQAARTADYVSSSQKGEKVELPVLSAKAVSPTFETLRSQPKDFPQQSFRFPVSLSDRLPTRASGMVSLRVQDIGPPIDVHLPARMDAATLQQWGGKRLSGALEARFEPSTTAQPLLTALFRSGDATPLIAFEAGDAAATVASSRAKTEPARSDRPSQASDLGDTGRSDLVVTSLAETSRTQRLAVDATGSVETRPQREISLKSGAAKPALSGIPMIRWSPNGELIAVAGFGRNVTVWDPNGQAAVRRTADLLPTGQRASLLLAWNPNSAWLHVSRAYPPDKESELTPDARTAGEALFDLQNGIVQAPLRSDCAPAFSQDGSRLFVVRGGKAIGFSGADFSSREVEIPLRTENASRASIYAIALNPAGDAVATLELSSPSAAGNGGRATPLELVVRKLSDPNHVLVRAAAEGHRPGTGFSLHWPAPTSRGTERVVLQGMDRTTLWTWSSGVGRSVTATQFNYYSALCSHNRDWSVVAMRPTFSGRPGNPTALDKGEQAPAGSHPEIAVYNLSAGEMTARLSQSAALMPFLSLSADGQRLATVLDISTVVVSRVEGTCANELCLRTGSPVVALDWSPSGDRLATCHADATIKIWKLSPGDVEDDSWNANVARAEASMAGRKWDAYHELVQELSASASTEQQQQAIDALERKRQVAADRLFAEFNRLLAANNRSAVNRYIRVMEECVACEPYSQRGLEVQNELVYIKIRYGRN